MNVFSRRYAWVLLAMMALAAVPIVAGSLAPSRADDCASPSRLLDFSAMPWEGEFAEVPERRGSGHLQWIEGVLTSQTAEVQRKAARGKASRGASKRNWWKEPEGGPETTTLNVRVVRSFDPFYLRQRATSTLGFTLIPDFREVKILPTPYGELVVHIARKYAASQSQFVAYAYIYDGKSVEVPLLAEMAALPESLFGGVRPLTVLLVQAIREHGTLGPAEAEALAWLEAAWSHYQHACFPGPASETGADLSASWLDYETLR